ncbi:MAG TPA: hypothetical protein VF765_31060 [Polyangiaceae bacterium]
MSVRGFSNSIGSYVPSWLAKRLNANVGYRFIWSMVVQLDVMMQGIVEGLQAPWPGVGTPTAFSAIGSSRGILRGETETDASYAARLIAWLDTWTNAGAAEVLASQIHYWLGNNPMVRIVNRSGQWVTCNTDGSITKTVAAWDWDSVSNPERSGFWSEIWIIVYPTEWAVTGSTLASLVGEWGVPGAQLGNGHKVPRIAVQTILGLVSTWKGAHDFVRGIIWSYDATLFDPASPVPGDPDGTWGNYMKYSGGVGVPARNANARYWEPEPTG